MATVTYSAVQTSLATLFGDTITKAINRSIVFAQIATVRKGRSHNINWAAKFGLAEAADPTFNDGADLSTFNNDTRLPATLGYGRYHDAFSVTGFARAVARATGNPAQMADLFGDELVDSVERLARGIARDIYTGTGATNKVHGMFATVPALGDTGTYAGIDRAAQAQWAGSVLDATAAPALTHDWIRKLIDAIYVKSGKRLDLFLSNSALYERLGLTYGANRRYLQMAQISRADGQKITLDGGFEALEFDGRPCIKDVQCPGGKFIGLNMREVFIDQLPDTVDDINRATGFAQLKGTEEYQLGPGEMKMSARVQPLATTGDAVKFALISYLQFVNRDPRCSGYIDNLTNTIS